MADYNANIKVNADTRSAEQAIKRLTTELDKIKNVTTAVKGVKNIGEAFVPKQALFRLEKGLQTVANRANTTEKVFARLVEAVGTLQVSGGIFEAINQGLKTTATTTAQAAANFSGAANKIDEFAASGDLLRTTLAQINNLFVDVGHTVARTVVPGFAVMDDTAQATAQTANKLQYALQQFLDSTEGIRTFVNSIGTLEGASGAAAVSIAALAAVVEGQLSEALYDIDVSASTALKQLAEDAAAGASELQRLIRATQGTVEQYENLITKGKERMRTVSAESDEARRAANTITQGQKLLNAELERQNDLLREARGLTQTGLEERKGVKSIQTKRKREEYLSDVAQGVEATLQAAAELDQELVNLDKHLADLDTAAAERRWQALEQQWKDADAAAAALSARMDEIRNKEAAASLKARGGKEPAPFDTGGVVRRTIAGPAYTEPAGPGGTGVTSASAIAAQARINKEFELRADYEAQIFRIENDFNKQVHFTELDFIQEELKAEIDKIEAIGSAQRKADTAALKDFDKRLTERTETKKKRRAMTENVIIGGAFPLLFGGGPGAVLGGAAGGLIPGNPMLSVATSAIGAAIDQFVSSVAELGVALNNVAGTFDTLKEKALISNREREKELQLLQDAGFAATANAVAQQELYKTIGVKGVESLRQLGSETDELNRVWAELGVQIHAVVAGPLANLAKALNDLLTPKAVAGRVEALRADLAPAQRTALNKELLALGGPGSARFGAQTKGLNVVEIELAARKFPDKVQALLDKYGPMRVNADIKFDPAQVREQSVNILQKELEILDITKKFTEAGEKQQEIDKQRYEIIKNYEESIAAIRRRIEDEIATKRLSVLQKENELLDVQARIRQESLSLSNAQAAATQGLPTGARDVARQAAEAAGSFVEQELALAEQAAKLKRDAALDALRTDLEAAKFQADTAREVNKLNIDTAKRVAALNDTVRKQNAQQDVRRFEIEKQLAIFRLQSIQAEFALLQRLAPTLELVQDAARLAKAAVDAIRYVEVQKPPAALQGVAGPAAQGVSFAGLDAINQQLKLTQERINAAQLALNDLLVLKNEQDFINKMQRIAENIDAPFETLNEELVTSEKTRTRYAELIRQGVRGAVAERLIEVEQLKQAAILQYDAVIAELQKKLAIEGTNKALEDQIEQLQKRRDAIEGRATSATAGIQKEESPAERLKDAATAAREELTELTDWSNQVVAGAAAIGDAFQQAFKGLVTGAMTGQEALAAFFKSVGDHFLDMASKMIAKLIEIYILETVVGFIAGAAGGSSGGPATSPAFAPPAVAAQGAYWPGGFEAFANGGMVTKPTMGLIGEGGEPEYVIPASKMRGAMSRYASGARGSAVIPANGDTEGGGTATMAPASIDVRYTVERINSVDYVTADQFQAGMQQAAAQGAERGQQLALRRLQQSPSTRRRVGI